LLFQRQFSLLRDVQVSCSLLLLTSSCH